MLAGLVERVTFLNHENGFCVLRAKARGHRELVTVIGHTATISAGEWITASGEWVNDRTHGQQFKARFMRTSAPTSIDGIEKYLGSGMIRGIGPVYAKKLVRAFGEKVFDTIEAEPERLREVTGIGPMRAKRITDAWAEQKIIREIMVFLHSNGVGTARAVRIYKTYGADAVQIMTENQSMEEEVQALERLDLEGLRACWRARYGQPGALRSTFTHGAKGQVYRYYVSGPLQQGKKADAADGAIRRVPAAALEAKLMETMARLLPSPRSRTDDPLARLVRVEVHPTNLQVLAPIELLSSVRSRLGPGEQAIVDLADPSRLRMILPIRVRLRGGRVWILGVDETRPTLAKRDPVLINALRGAHALMSDAPDGSPALKAAPVSPHERKRIRLAFLAPDLQAAILDGRQPAGLTLARLVQSPLPLLWSEQALAF